MQGHEIKSRYNLSDDQLLDALTVASVDIQEDYSDEEVSQIVAAIAKPCPASNPSAAPEQTSQPRQANEVCGNSELALSETQTSLDMTLSSHVSGYTSLLQYADEATDTAAPIIAKQLAHAISGDLLAGKVAKELEGLLQGRKMPKTPTAKNVEVPEIIDLSAADRSFVPLQYKGGEVQQFQLNQAD